MKLFAVFSLLIGFLFHSAPSEARHGLKNFKTVMPGILYRGGNNGNGKAPMKDASLKGLCQDGFSAAVYLYPTSSNRDKTMSCGSNTIKYHNLRMDRDKQILGIIFRAIQSSSGPIYAHCWHGVHASGYIAAVALRQFCGYSAEQAVSYWNAHVPPSIRYPHVQKKIRDFRPDSGMQLSSAQASRHCP